MAFKHKILHPAKIAFLLVGSNAAKNLLGSLSAFNPGKSAHPGEGLVKIIVYMSLHNPRRASWTTGPIMDSGVP